MKETLASLTTPADEPPQQDRSWIRGSGSWLVEECAANGSSVVLEGASRVTRGAQFGHRVLEFKKTAKETS